jgi:tRNA(Glu) U13 pseudouridine synthase TruD
VELRAEVETLRAQVQALRDVCEQQVKDRSLYSADRDKCGLDYIDGWNDALDIVEQALDGAPVSERLMSRAEVESVTYKALIYALAEVAALRWQVRQDHCPCACDGEGN